jgi:hypothetical protein
MVAPSVVFALICGSDESRDESLAVCAPVRAPGKMPPHPLFPGGRGTNLFPSQKVGGLGLREAGSERYTRSCLADRRHPARRWNHRLWNLLLLPAGSCRRHIRLWYFWFSSDWSLSVSLFAGHAIQGGMSQQAVMSSGAGRCDPAPRTRRPCASGPGLRRRLRRSPGGCHPGSAGHPDQPAGHP